MPSSRGSSQPRDQTCVSNTAGRFFTVEPMGKPAQAGTLRKCCPSCCCQASGDVALTISYKATLSCQTDTTNSTTEPFPLTPRSWKPGALQMRSQRANTSTTVLCCKSRRVTSVPALPSKPHAAGFDLVRPYPISGSLRNAVIYSPDSAGQEGEWAHDEHYCTTTHLLPEHRPLPSGATPSTSQQHSLICCCCCC